MRHIAMMKIYPEELSALSHYRARHQAPLLSDKQIEALAERAKLYSAWQNQNLFLSNLINFVALLGSFALLLTSHLLILPKLGGLMSLFLLSLASGALTYSIIVYTLHTGAGHNAIFKGSTRAIRWLNSLGAQSCRLLFCDPEYYRQAHIKHHQFTGTKDDGAFTNMVHPKRFFLSLIPVWGALGLTDYKIHNGSRWTLSHTLSHVLGTLFLALIISFSWKAHNLAELAFYLFSCYSFTFLLDRLRESTEHNLMHVGRDGARSFGFNFWSLLVGGGPWGQPCHLSHHLFPHLTWYHQILMHYDFKKIMNPEQRAYFLLEGQSYPGFLVKALLTNFKAIQAVEQK